MSRVCPPGGAYCGRCGMVSAPDDVKARVAGGPIRALVQHQEKEHRASLRVADHTWRTVRETHPQPIDPEPRGFAVEFPDGG